MLTEGYQDKQVKKRESSWLPTWPQLLVYLGVATLVTTIAYRNVVLGWLGGEALQQLGGIQFVTEGENYYLDNLFGIPILGTIAVVFFWAALGCTIYCIVWGLTNTVHEAKKYEEVSEGSVMPSNQNKQTFWKSSLANIVLLISSVFAFILFVTLAFSFALPVSKQLLQVVLSSTPSMDAAVAILLFAIGSVAIGHGIYLSVLTFNYARRVVFF